LVGDDVLIGWYAADFSVRFVDKAWTQMLIASGSLDMWLVMDRSELRRCSSRDSCQSSSCAATEYLPAVASTIDVLQPSTASPAVAAGGNCWPSCYRRSGPCDWCGAGGKCCRQGYGGGEKGCTITEGHISGHKCVAHNLSTPRVLGAS
jgi:hypothetical protein